MPITQTTVTHVECDNPACPGNTLPIDDLAGWSLVSVEVYGEGSAQKVFCSAQCVSDFTGSLATEGKTLV